MLVRTKRVYETPSSSDGVRVLIDRLWPRGLTKDAAAIDLWLRDAAPSHELRKWYQHDPAKWSEFRERYFAELDGQPGVLSALWDLAASRVTLVFSSREQELNNATALKEYMEGREARRRKA